MILAQWPVPTWIRVFTTTRTEGNFGQILTESSTITAQRRDNAFREWGIAQRALALDQVHGNDLVEAVTTTPVCQAPPSEMLKADGVWTQTVGLPCSILTADCLPVVLCDEGGTVVATLHCGWRGLAQGMISKAVHTLQPKAQGKLLAWLGPAIGPTQFEVGRDVYLAFTEQDPALAAAFKPRSKPGKWLASLTHIARHQLHALGITGIYGEEHCTYTQSDTFYSYRREPQTGRLLTLAIIDPH